jgi:hypothetical protein
MGIGYNPKIVTNGLVFAYDMGNTFKSFKGAPTTNLYTDGNFASKTLHPIRGAAFWSFPAGVVDPEGNQVIRVDQNGGTNYHGRDITVSAGLTYTASCWIFVSSDSNTTSVSLFNEQGFPYNASYNLSNKGTWQKVSVTGVTTGTNARILAYQLSAMTTGYCLFGSIQFEQQSFATPFVNGTRANTQSIIDLTNRNIITANSLTYASNSTFSFNGTSDVMRPSISHSYLSSSCLEVWFRSTSHGSGNKTIFGYRHNDGFSSPTIGSIYLNGNNLYGSLITASQVYRQVLSSTVINTNTWYHTALNKNTQTGNLDLYLNGELSGTQTFDVSTYGQYPSAGNFIGDNILDIGKSTNMNSGQGWSSDYFTGLIPIAKVYSQTLTAVEIRQNYNALRGRFGI